MAISFSLQSGVAGVAAENNLLASPMPAPPSTSLLVSIFEAVGLTGRLTGLIGRLTGLAGLLEGLGGLVGETALFRFHASLGVSTVDVVGFLASIAGVTASPNLAIGVGTDLIFSKRALRWERGMQEGSGDSTAGVWGPSNMLRFCKMLLDCKVSVGCSSLLSAAGVAWKVLDGLGGPAGVVLGTLGPKEGFASCPAALLGDGCLMGIGLLGDAERGKARPGL